MTSVSASSSPATCRSRRRLLMAPLSAAVLTLLGSLPLPRLAIAATDNERLKAVRLDADLLGKLESSIDRMAAAIKASPALQRELKLAKRKDEDDDDDDDSSGGSKQMSLKQMADFYRSKPALRQAIESSGLTTERFAEGMMALMQSMLAWAMAQAVPADKRAKALADTGLPPANIKFVEQNQARIQKLGKSMEALNH